MLFPDCSPNFKEKYISDSRKLFLDEELFIARWVRSLNASHIVILDKFYQNEKIKGYLQRNKYKKVVFSIFIIKFNFLIKI